MVVMMMAVMMVMVMVTMMSIRACAKTSAVPFREGRGQSGQGKKQIPRKRGTQKLG